MKTKVSEINANDIARYCRIGEIDSKEEEDIDTYIKIAKNYIENYTGIPEKSSDESEETLDSYSDFIIVVYILCQDLYDNRSMYVDGKSINKTVQTILDMHTRNNL